MGNHEEKTVERYPDTQEVLLGLVCFFVAIIFLGVIFNFFLEGVAYLWK